jgi:hypothetical protein
MSVRLVIARLVQSDPFLGELFEFVVVAFEDESDHPLELESGILDSCSLLCKQTLYRRYALCGTREFTRGTKRQRISFGSNY